MKKQLLLYHSAHVDLIASAFRIETKEIDEFIKRQIYFNANNKNYKNAIDISRRFCKTVPFKVFLQPLIFDNGFNEVKEYCKIYMEFQYDMLKCMDKMLLSGTPECRTYINNLKEDFGEEFINKGLEYLLEGQDIWEKVMKNRIRSLLKYFELEDSSQSITPNYWWYSRSEAIKYIINKYYRDKTLDFYCYINFIKGYLREAPIEKIQWLVRYLWTSGQADKRHDAIMFTWIYNLFKWHLSPDMAEYMNKRQEYVNDIYKEISEMYPNDDLTNIKVNKKEVVIVDTVDDLRKLAARFSQEQLIGIDTESVDEIIFPSQTALIQIAVSDKIFLVDSFKLENVLSPNDRNMFFNALLLGDELKLGFDFYNDLSSMNSEFGPKYEITNKNCLCLKVLSEKLTENHADFFGSSKVNNDGMSFQGSPTYGLQDLCKKILNETLDKREQQSNWTSRPLRKKQVHYAARDADILIELFKAIKEKALRMGINFDSLVQESLVDSIKQKKKEKKIDSMTWSEIYETLRTSPEPDNKSIKAQNFKCVVDQMHHGLGKHLRRCGVDVILSNKDEIEKIAKRERDRILISSGKAAEKLTKGDHAKRVWDYAGNWSMIAQLKDILKKGGVKLDPTEKYTRCPECNNLGFLVTPMPVIQALHNYHVICKEMYYNEEFDKKGWKEKIQNIQSENYEGISCTIEDSENSFIVTMKHGMVDILDNTITREESEKKTKTMINKLPTNHISEGQLFYICWECGKIYHDT